MSFFKYTRLAYALRRQLLLPNTSLSAPSLGCQSGAGRSLASVRPFISPPVCHFRVAPDDCLSCCAAAAAALHFMVPGNINKCNLLIPLRLS